MAETNPNQTAEVHEEEGEETNQNRTAGVHEEEGEEGEHVVIFDATRHEHELCLFEGLPTYTCSGCKENGANIGYKCKLNDSLSCKDFTLHEACATLPDVFQHPFRRLFKFRLKTHLWHHCGACRDMMRGYVFERPDHFRLHPLCMVLTEKLHYSGHANHQLKFVRENLKGACSVCGKNIRSGRWRYRCEKVNCNFCVDLSCAKIDFYGHSDSGIAKVVPISSSNTRFISKPSSAGKWVAAAFLGDTIKGTKRAIEPVVGDII